MNRIQFCGISLYTEKHRQALIKTTFTLKALSDSLIQISLIHFVDFNIWGKKNIHTVQSLRNYNYYYRGNYKKNIYFYTPCFQNCKNYNYSTNKKHSRKLRMKCQCVLQQGNNPKHKVYQKHMKRVMFGIHIFTLLYLE